MINIATRFNDCWYDLSYNEIMELIENNLSSSFVYIKYIYNEMGSPECWFKDISNQLQNDWRTIKREVLLEWEGVEQ